MKRERTLSARMSLAYSGEEKPWATHHSRSFPLASFSRPRNLKGKFSGFSVTVLILRLSKDDLSEIQPKGYL